MFRKLTAATLVLTALTLLSYLGWTLSQHPEELVERALPGLPLLLVLVVDGLVARYLCSSKPWSYRRLVPIFLLLVTSVGMASYAVAVVYVDHMLAERTHEGVVNDCHKVWAARGLVREGPNITRNGTQNSIESIQLAFDEGAQGTEVDVFFDTEMGHFIVSHDRPYNLKNGELLTLAALLKATGADGAFWLDFKKLRMLDDAGLAAAVAELEELTLMGGLKQRFYVEGEDPINLSAFRDAGFKTILDTHPLPDSNFVTPGLINLYKLLFYFGDFTVMGMNYGMLDDPIYGARTRQSLGTIPVFIYHVDDDASVLDELTHLEAVRVILVKNHSVNRYDLSGCP
ncbi:MAG: hypothetical protein ACI8QZ_001927 [Chlamydiales bacterium]|jgi:hypothetical protein